MHTEWVGITEISRWGTPKFLTDNMNEPLIMAKIQELSKENSNMSFSDINGEFNINLHSDFSIIEISYIGFESLIIRTDTIDKDNFHCILKDAPLKEVIVIAPSPPAIELGYYGLVSNYPIGFHSKYSSYKFQAHFNYVMNNRKNNNYYDFEIVPYRFKNHKLNQYFTPYLKGIIAELNNNVQSNLLLCNEFKLNNFAFNVGIGIEMIQDNTNKLLFLAGFRKYFSLPLPFFSTYIDVDFLYNKNYCGILSSLYFEFYSRKYCNLTLMTGYQSIFDKKDMIINIIYLTEKHIENETTCFLIEVN